MNRLLDAFHCFPRIYPRFNKTRNRSKLRGMESNYEKLTAELCSFIAKSPTQFHAVRNMEDALEEHGFQRLDERERWHIERGKGYFVQRNGSSLAIFSVPEKPFSGFSLVSAHTDSPVFKIKTDPEVTSSGLYTTLNTEVYGGLLMAPWFDRPLSIAGRVCVRSGSGFEERLVDFGRDLVLIPNLAIHMNRKANEGIAYSAQTDMLPLFAEGCTKGRFMKAVAEAAEADESDLLEYDLYLYPRTPWSMWGLDNEFFSSPRIDDLMCAYTAFSGALEAKGDSYMPLTVLFDNEETGSGTKQGALSDFLPSVSARIEAALGMDDEAKAMAAASSFMISADNCHALHPDSPEKCDITNKPRMNGGVAIKFSATQKYTTDAASASTLRLLLEKEGIPYQYFANNSDIPGGSTLGNLSAQKFSIPTVDIGAAQLAMHSPYETAGTRDTEALLRMFSAFLSR